MKHSAIASCVIGTALTVGAIVGLSVWSNRTKWDSEIAEATIAELNDDYNLAIAAHPADRNRALFALDVAVRKRRGNFEATYGAFDEYVDWAIRYEAQVENLRKVIRKG
ncbi:hypothetical protein ST201phi2-1p180 [Pseudomonas phage 201phi2-1]|uniref:Uncharacterized protein n=1 Tax=Pseudomonas phage 201phi2-1 TaxID=198110 RepID=B3FJ43_BP201|nr:hypothetical protein ST201phi2-1p180 [Pseudomonas phage 201phi2-1]ABY63010.1 hypothetical protein 201phi2-1p180 [Pseudomonas phage 201phi2-1]